MDENAVSNTTCSNPMKHHHFFWFVPLFTMCLIIINQAKWRQAPIMLVIAFVGYVVNYFTALRFSGNTQVSNTLGALSIGVMANTYSRMGSRVENKCLDIWEDKLRPHWRNGLKAVHEWYYGKSSVQMNVSLLTLGLPHYKFMLTASSPVSSSKTPRAALLEIRKVPLPDIHARWDMVWLLPQCYQQSSCRCLAG